MFERKAASASIGLLRTHRLHAVTARAFFSLHGSHCGEEQRGHSSTTSATIVFPVFSNSPSSSKSEVNRKVESEEAFSAPLTSAASATSERSNACGFTGPQEDGLKDAKNSLEGADGEDNAIEVVRQLQRLAARRPQHQSPADTRTSLAHDADAGISAVALADLMTDEASAFDDGGEHHVKVGKGDAVSTDQQQQNAAWEAGLQLAEGVVEKNDELAEWLLFLCLRSQDGATGSPAPLEVCEGVYQAWRQQRRKSAAASAQHQSSAQHSEALLRSPFEPKGVHHHFAVWLLREFHSTWRVVQEACRDTTAFKATAAACVKDAGDAGFSGSPAEVSTEAEYNQLEVMHHACLLLNRTLEVLLLDEPLDVVVDVAAACAPAPSRQPHRRHRLGCKAAQLRPSSALLVLEASRQLTQLLAQQQRLGAPDCTAAFPFLSFLTAKSGPAKATTTPLMEVAREAFELILRSTSPPMLQSDAVVQYLGFLISASPSSVVPAANVDHFVRCGSLTARRVSRHTNSLKAEELEQQQQHETTRAAWPLDDHATSNAIAAAVRTLLSAYLTDQNPAMLNRLTALLPQSTPGSLSSLFILPELEDAPLDMQQYGNSGGSQADSHPIESTRVKKPVRPVSWCAWLLRVLLCDLEWAGRAAATTADDVLPHRSLPPSPSGGDAPIQRKIDAAEAWQRQSKWTISITARLMMQLQQQQHFKPSSALAAAQPSHFPQWKKRSSVKAAQRPFQEVWRLVFLAALQGSFYHIALDQDALMAASLHRQRRSGLRGESAQAPPILVRLCYPYYDKTLWRAPSVNLYVRLLDQWGQGEHIRQVMATVARREGDYQAEVQAAVAAEQAEACHIKYEEESDEAHKPSSSSSSPGSPNDGAAAKPVHGVFRRYRPALSLHSCLIALKHCGCSPRLFAALAPGGETSSTLLSSLASDDAEVSEEGSSTAFTTAADARLAGQVLQYMLCSLHVVERNAAQRALRGSFVDTATGNENECDAAKQEGPSPPPMTTTFTLMTEGFPLAGWVEWVRDYAVPAVEKLYQNAGLEEEWHALGY